MYILKLVYALKGGSGSGNHGHSGIPGKQGGSLPGHGIGDTVQFTYSGDAVPKKLQGRVLNVNDRITEVSVNGETYRVRNANIQTTDKQPITKPTIVEDAKIVQSETAPKETVKLLDSWQDVPTQSDVARKAYFIRKDGKIVPVTAGGGEHAETIASHPEALGLDKVTIDNYVKSAHGAIEGNLDLWIAATDAGNIRVSSSKKETGIDNLPLTSSNLKRLQKFVDDGKLPGSIDHKYSWTDSINDENRGLSFTYDELMNSKYVVNKDGRYQLKSLDSVLKGIEILIHKQRRPH